MNLKLELDEQSADLLAKRMVAQLYPKAADPEQSSPINELRNWIRAEDLYDQKLFSKTTLNKYYNHGLIGKSTIGGSTFYYVPHILGLLEAAHVKKDVMESIGNKMREKR